MDDKIDKMFDAEFSNLIALTLEIGNSIIINNSTDLIYASGLGKKITSHIITAKHLYNGYEFQIGAVKFVPRIDFSSIFVLARTALETYLTFNHLYISPKSKGEHDFRFLCWDLAGLLERADIKARQKQHIEIKEEERIAIQKYVEAIKNHEYFNTLGDFRKSRALSGDWRLKKQWNELAEESGFNKTFFNQQYSFLCCYSHASRLSVMQIQQIEKIEDQRNQARAFITLMMIILSKFSFDYVNLIPELKSTIDLNGSKYKTMASWREYASTYDPNSSEYDKEV